MRDVDVFLFDEPLSNLDAKLRSELRVEIKRLHQQLENTMIYVTHDQIEAMTLADRIAVMKSGVIQQLDDAARPSTTGRSTCFVAGFIGSPAMNFLEGAAIAADGAPRFVADGHRHRRSPATTSTTDARRGRAVLGIRPEHIAIDARRRTGRSPRTRGRRDRRADGLRHARLDTGSAARTSRSASPPSARRAPATTVAVGFDPMNASLFDAAAGERL